VASTSKNWRDDYVETDNETGNTHNVLMDDCFLDKGHTLFSHTSDTASFFTASHCVIDICRFPYDFAAQPYQGNGRSGLPDFGTKYVGPYPNMTLVDHTLNPWNLGPTKFFNDTTQQIDTVTNDPNWADCLNASGYTFGWVGGSLFKLGSVPPTVNMSDCITQDRKLLQPRRCSLQQRRQ
jgi:hypothetical protein